MERRPNKGCSKPFGAGRTRMVALEINKEGPYFEVDSTRVRLKLWWWLVETPPRLLFARSYFHLRPASKISKIQLWHKETLWNQRLRLFVVRQCVIFFALIYELIDRVTSFISLLLCATHETSLSQQTNYIREFPKKLYNQHRKRFK